MLHYYPLLSRHVTAREDIDHTKIYYLTLGIRFKGIKPIWCLLHPPGEEERLDQEWVYLGGQYQVAQLMSLAGICFL